ncbi:MAG: hypothetical protein JO057_12995 [Chloroflexi bacterium]|nr:hypothetical protein [Chloroflexota bacterium]
MASPTPEDRARGEILRSNVEGDQSTPMREAPRRNTAVLPLVLAGALLFVLGVGAALLFSSLTRPRSATTIEANARPTTAAAPAADGSPPDINGISCDTLEATIVHIHMHLAIFVNGQEEQIPYGIGIGQPWQITGSDEGPFVVDGSCFYWIHTHTADGVVHIESPLRRRFTLGDFFAIWQMPLSTSQVGPAQGPVVLYVNGEKSSTNPPDVPLLAHERVQLDVGDDVPPYQFDFPDGD